MQIKKATRKNKKLRMSISAPPGGGKTLGSLIMARQIAGSEGKILVFDTEFGRASLHADRFDFDVVEWGAEEVEAIQKRRAAGEKIDTIDINPPTVKDYIRFIQLGEANGYDVLVIDSATPEWEDIKKRQQDYKKKLKNDYAAWGPALKDHAGFVNKVLYSSCHIILTIRAKEKHEITDDRKVVSLGVGEEQQKDLRFFMDFVFAISDRSTHEVSVEKAPPEIMEKYEGVSQVLNSTMVQTIKTWLEEGIPAETADLITRIQELSVEYMTENPEEEFSLPPNLSQLDTGELVDIGKELRAKLDNLKERKQIKQASVKSVA